MPQRLQIDPTLPLTVGRFLLLGGNQRNGQGRVRAAEVLDEVGAGTIMETPLQAVSGGEFQRVVLARALLRDPDLLVLDEPSQGIDVNGQAALYRLIASIRDRRGCGVLMVSHDLHLVMADTDEVVCLNHHVCCAGHPETVTSDPNYIQLFGKQVASTLAVYHHHHDHEHDAGGNVVSLAEAALDTEKKTGEREGHHG
jgi:zinc transport system ATP-binding protein